MGYDRLLLIHFPQLHWTTSNLYNFGLNQRLCVMLKFLVLCVRAKTDWFLLSASFEEYRHLRSVLNNR
jgi:hypothetical protein